MFRPRSVHGLFNRTVTAQRRNPARVDLALQRISWTLEPSSRANLLQCRLASTSTSRSTSSDASSTPPSPQPPKKPKVELRPGPVKPTPASTASAPTASASPPAPAPAKPDAVEAADAVKAHAYTSGKAVEQMSTFETMKFDVRDAVARGIMRAPPEDAGKMRQVMHQMWEVLKFYANGVRQIWAHGKEVRAMKARAKEGGVPLTRAETRFIRIYRADVLKMIPFVAIALVLEEIIPLLVLYAPFMLPSTCILPSQRERIQRKQREKQIAFLSLREYFDQVREAGAEKGFVTLAELEGTSLQAMCGLLGVSTWGPSPARRFRLKRTFQYLANDDAQIREEGNGAQLSEEELVQALHERAITSETLPQSERLRQLQWWLKSADPENAAGDAVTRRALLVASIGSTAR